MVSRNDKSNQPDVNTQDPSPMGHRVIASTWADYVPTLFTPKQFFTLTSRDPVSESRMWSRHGKIVQEVNRKIWGNNWQRKGEGVSFLAAVEPHKSGNLHLHAVWDAEYVPYDLVHSLANRISGYAWIEPVTRDSSVGYYVTKYAVKSGSVFVYLSRHKQALGNAGL